jgi:hypothetical protein
VKYILLVLLLSGCSIMLGGCEILTHKFDDMKSLYPTSEDCTVYPQTKECADQPPAVNLIGEV